MLLGQAGEITRESAREAARAELAKPEYRVGEPSVLDRAVTWFAGEIAELLGRAVRIVPGGIGGVIVLVLLAVGLAVLLRLGLGPLQLRDGLTDRRRGARDLTAAEYRGEAAALAADGRWREALRARFRAVVRELEQRGVLDHRPGRTAGEIAREAGAAVPTLGEPTREAASLFDSVWYGERPATRDDYDVMVAIDAAVAQQRLAVTTTS